MIEAFWKALQALRSCGSATALSGIAEAGGQSHGVPEVTALLTCHDAGEEGGYKSNLVKETLC